MNTNPPRDELVPVEQVDRLTAPSYWKSSDGYTETFDNTPSEAAATITAQAREIATLKAEILGMQRGINQSLGRMEHHTATIRLAGCRLQSALRRSRIGWENVIDLDMLPERHRPAANELIEDAAAAIAEWDMAND